MKKKLQLQSAIKPATKSFDAENNNQSIFEQNIQRGIEAGIISFNEDKSKITYACSRTYITGFKNPEEKVRASYFCELVLDYNYPKEKMDFEVLVPRRTPEDRADIIIYEDEELKTPYLVVETKKDGITDAEFKQAIEQAFGNANSIRAKLASVVAGTTKTAFDVAGFKPSERAKNVISDIPKSLKSDISHQDSAMHEAKSYDSFKDAVNDFEKEYITTILKENEWNISKTAEVLQLDRSHLHRKIKALDIIFPVY